MGMCPESDCCKVGRKKMSEVQKEKLKELLGDYVKVSA